MLHEIGAGHAPRARPSLLVARERPSLLAIARAALPEGRFFAGAGTRAIDKVENFLTLSPPSVARAYRAMLLALDAWGAGRAIARRSRRCRRRRCWRSILERWRGGDIRAPHRRAHADRAAQDRALQRSEDVRRRRLSLQRLAGARGASALHGARHRGGPSSTATTTVECDVVVIGTGALAARSSRASSPNRGTPSCSSKRATTTRAPTSPAGPPTCSASSIATWARPCRSATPSSRFRSAAPRSVAPPPSTPAPAIAHRIACCANGGATSGSTSSLRK